MNRAQRRAEKKATVAIQMPLLQATNLYEKLIEIVGKPNYNDTFDKGDCRMKWKHPFEFNKALKIKELLNSYPSYYIKEYRPRFMQKDGKGEGREQSVIWLIVRPQIVPYPYTNQRQIA